MAKMYVWTKKAVGYSTLKEGNNTYAKEGKPAPYNKYLINAGFIEEVK